MHNALTILYILAFLAAGYAEGRWNSRPAARARWAALSLREKIARQVRRTRLAAAIQAGLLVLFPALGLAGVLPPGSWVTGVIVAGAYLVIDLYLLRRALAARRAYGKLGPLAYLAEIRNAFGTMQPAQTPDVTAHNVRMLPGPGGAS